MATKSKQIVRRAPSVPKRKYEMALRAASLRSAKARQVAAKRVGTLVGAGAGALAGYLERTGRLQPKFTSPAAFAAAGALLAFVAPETGLGRGKLGQMAAEAGAGMLAVAAYKLGQGQAVIGADDDEVGYEDE